jgi:hypothetical protein
MRVGAPARGLELGHDEFAACVSFAGHGWWAVALRGNPGRWLASGSRMCLNGLGFPTWLADYGSARGNIN